ncbi:MAG TPA: hypothetical protein VHX88_12920 [Solirubrobacteraceae bacterium]|jgi:hypothetical protein|nr:hypothetical protein [Solirubrobacteraceae bacterium]
MSEQPKFFQQVGADLVAASARRAAARAPRRRARTGAVAASA